jgi:hypothetical protein
LIVKVSKRGWSFKGAGLYYLNPKRNRDGQSKSQEDRVGFFETHNLPTEDRQKAINFMAYTAKNANLLKDQAGVSSRGRKQKHGEVYSYSLSWSPEENPDQETMREAARSSLKKLKLDQDYQAVFIQHTDTDHAHVHVLVNLISFKDGRIANVGNDQVKLSKWAEHYEREHGGIILDKRVENNKRREELAKDKELRKADRKAEKETPNSPNDKSSKNELSKKKNNGIVKHREERLRRADEISKLYFQSDNGKAFASALQESGYTLAKGDSRGFVIVDDYGKIYSLSRQLHGQRAKDIKARLSDLKHVPDARLVADDRLYFDRDKYEAEQQRKIEKAAIEKSQKEISQQRSQKGKSVAPIGAKSFAAELDQERHENENTRINIIRVNEELRAFYSPARSKYKEEIKSIEEKLRGNKRLFYRITGRDKILKENLSGLNKSLENLEIRYTEKKEAEEKKVEKSKASQEHEIRRKQLRKRSSYFIPRKDKGHDMDKGHDYSP